MNKKVGKRGAIAIWAILAIVLVISIVILLFFRFKPEIFHPKQVDYAFEMQDYLDSCTSSAIEEVQKIILPRGGFLNPKNYVMYNGYPVEYHCKISWHYRSCIQQHSMLIKEIEKEIENYIYQNISNCFLNMKEEFENRGAKMFFENPMSINVKLGEDRVVVNIKRNTKITKQDHVREFDNFEVTVKSPIYNLAVVAMEISSQEGDPKSCYFDATGYSLYNPRYKIELYNLYPDGTKVYIIQDKKSKEIMHIAIRSCTIPRGL